MDLNSIIHIIFIVFFCSLPLFPDRYMYIIRWFPLILIGVWIIFEGCPLTIIDKNLTDKTFIQVLIDPFIKLSKERVDILTTFFLFVIFALCNDKYYRFKFKK